MNMRKVLYSVAAVALAVSAFALVTPTLAQGPVGSGTTTTSGVGFGTNFWVVEACSTTDYATLVANALGITATDLRKALAGGTSISALAEQNGVELSAVQDAVKTARIADIDAAVTAGLLTEDEGQALKDLLENGTLTIAPGLQNRAGQPSTDDDSDDDSTDVRPFRLQIHVPEGLEDLMLGFGPGLMGRFGFGVGGFGFGLGQQVNTFQVAATALNMSCTDLVKSVLNGDTIAEVASQTDGGLQAVTDALVAAHESAIDTALSEGLISQVNAESAKAGVLNRVLMEISRSGGRGGMGFAFGMADDDMPGLGGMMGGMMDRLRDHLGGMMGGRGQRGR
ncbi:MAG: hypothetical protein IT323_15160 [Anaerolineae bacterium]|nr:hypothetical protein [Anaerolineae bacterium]